MKVRIEFGEPELPIKERIAASINANLESGMIGEALNNEIEKWCPRRSVFISAQTGAGKTTFIKEQLTAHCTQSDQPEIMVVFNRLAVGRQFKIDLAKKFDKQLYDKLIVCLAKGQWELIDMVKIIGPVWVESYQHLVNEVDLYTDKETHFLVDLSKTQKIYIGQIKYVVFDEAHYFYEDATFNPYTELCLDKVIEKFSNKIRIYMSATLDDSLQTIYEKERRYFGEQFAYLCKGESCEKCLNLTQHEASTVEQHRVGWDEYKGQECVQINDCRYRAVLYEFPTDYSRYEPYFFDLECKTKSKNERSS